MLPATFMILSNILLQILNEVLQVPPPIVPGTVPKEPLGPWFLAIV